MLRSEVVVHDHNVSLHADCCIICMSDLLARKSLQQHLDFNQPRALLCLAVLLTIIKEKLACCLSGLNALT